MVDYSKFTAKRITKTYRQTINASAEKVFPLLCPVREAEWLDGWRYDLIYSDSGMAEEGAVFSTPHDTEADTIWVITQYDPATYRIQFTRFTPGSRTCMLTICVKPQNRNHCFVAISYTYTGISDAGNDFIDHFTDAEFLDAVTFWENSMNYYLETGRQLKRD